MDYALSVNFSGTHPRAISNVMICGRERQILDLGKLSSQLSF